MPRLHLVSFENQHSDKISPAEPDSGYFITRMRDVVTLHHMHCQRRILKLSSHSRTSLYITLTSAEPPSNHLSRPSCTNAAWDYSLTHIACLFARFSATVDSLNKNKQHVVGNIVGTHTPTTRYSPAIYSLQGAVNFNLRLIRLSSLGADGTLTRPASSRLLPRNHLSTLELNLVAKIDQIPFG